MDSFDSNDDGFRTITCCFWNIVWSDEEIRYCESLASVMGGKFNLGKNVI